MEQIITYKINSLTEPLGRVIKAPIQIKLNSTGVTYEITTNYGPKDTLQKVLNDGNYVKVSEDLNLGVISPTDGALGHTEKTKIIPLADTGAWPTVIFQPSGLNAAALDGKYFILEDVDGTVAFWIDTDNSGTAEPAHGATRSVEITTIVTGDNSSAVLTKVSAAINADSKFVSYTEEGIPTTLTAKCTDLFVSSNQNVGDSQFTNFTIQEAGAVSNIDGKFFYLYDELDRKICYWFQAAEEMYIPVHLSWNSGTAEPANDGDFSVKIEFEPGSSINNMKSVIQTFIDDEGYHQCSSVEYSGVNYPTTETNAIGPVTNFIDGNTGFTFEVVQAGDSVPYEATPAAVVGAYGYKSDYSEQYLKVTEYTWKKITLSSL